MRRRPATAAIIPSSIRESHLGMDLWTLGKTIFGDRLALALYPHEGRKEPDAVIIAQVKDAAALNRIRERLDPLLVLMSDQAQVSAGPGGSTVRNYAGQVFIADKDNWVAVASTPDLLGLTVVRLTAANPDAPQPLSADAPYVAMTKLMGPQHLVRSYINLELIVKSMGGRLGPEKLDNPVLSLINGGIYELANRSPFFGSTLDLDEQHLLITHAVAGTPESLGEK